MPGIDGDLPFHPERKIRTERIFRALQVPLEPERRRFTDYRTSALFTPRPNRAVPLVA